MIRRVEAKPVWWVFCLSMIVLLAGSIIWAANGGSDSQNSVLVTITSQLSGTKNIPVAVNAGNTFAITVPSNRTTGYRWRLAGQPSRNVVKVIGSSYIAPRTGRLGQSGTEVWSLQAIRPGNTNIVLQYARPWEKTVQPAKTQVFFIVVQ